MKTPKMTSVHVHVHEYTDLIFLPQVGCLSFRDSCSHVSFSVYLEALYYISISVSTFAFSPRLAYHRSLRPSHFPFTLTLSSWLSSSSCSTHDRACPSH